MCWVFWVVIVGGWFDWCWCVVVIGVYFFVLVVLFFKFNGFVVKGFGRFGFVFDRIFVWFIIVIVIIVVIIIVGGVK